MHHGQVRWLLGVESHPRGRHTCRVPRKPEMKVMAFATAMGSTACLLRMTSKTAWTSVSGMVWSNTGMYTSSATLSRPAGKRSTALSRNPVTLVSCGILGHAGAQSTLTCSRKQRSWQQPSHSSLVRGCSIWGSVSAFCTTHSAPELQAFPTIPMAGPLMPFLQLHHIAGAHQVQGNGWHRWLPIASANPSGGHILGQYKVTNKA